VSVDVTVEQSIARPRQEVAAFAMDPANDQRWIGALSQVNVLTDGPVGTGTQVERIANFLGKKMVYVNEITAYEPPARLAMRSIKAPFPLTVTYEFDEVPGDATLARIHTAGDPKGFYSLAGPLMGAAVRKGVERDLRKLKELLEDESPQSGA
jgi:uncharacterized membrane protein